MEPVASDPAKPVALGVEPGLPYVGGMPVPEGEDESHFLGAYFGEPLEMVRAETVDLLVPATAEIIIEGHVSLTDLADERPVASDFAHNWSPELQRHVLDNWQAYGYR